MENSIPIERTDLSRFEAPHSIDIHQFEQKGKQCGVRVNFFDADELMQAIEEGAKQLNLTDKVWLTGYLKG